VLNKEEFVKKNFVIHSKILLYRG